MNKFNLVSTWNPSLHVDTRLKGIRTGSKTIPTGSKNTMQYFYFQYIGNLNNKSPPAKLPRIGTWWHCLTTRGSKSPCSSPCAPYCYLFRQRRRSTRKYDKILLLLFHIQAGLALHNLLLFHSSIKSDDKAHIFDNRSERHLATTWLCSTLIWPANDMRCHLPRSK